jgi:hypothetical protein
MLERLILGDSCKFSSLLQLEIKQSKNIIVIVLKVFIIMIFGILFLGFPALTPSS